MNESENDVRDGSKAGAMAKGEVNARAGGPSWTHDRDDQEKDRDGEANRDDAEEGSPCGRHTGRARARAPWTSRDTAVGARASPVDRDGEECASRYGRA